MPTFSAKNQSENINDCTHFRGRSHLSNPVIINISKTCSSVIVWARAREHNKLAVVLVYRVLIIRHTYCISEAIPPISIYSAAAPQIHFIRVFTQYIGNEERRHDYQEIVSPTIQWKTIIQCVA